MQTNILKRPFVVMLLACALQISCPNSLMLPLVWAENETKEATAPIAERLYDKAEWVFQNAGSVKYEHYHHVAAQQVRETPEGLISRNDCSGFVSYVIHAIAPKHYVPIRDEQSERAYPQAKTYAKFFGSLSTTEPRDGWLGLASYRDLRRGDFIAWEKGDSQNDHGGHGNSGHVMMVRDKPGEEFKQDIDGKVCRLVNIPVIDSSSVYHFPPETLPPHAGLEHRNGLGKGDIRLLLDKNGNTIGYWEGTYWGEGQKDVKHPSRSTMVHFGRMVSNLNH